MCLSLLMSKGNNGGVWIGSPFLTEERLLPQFDSLSVASSCMPSGDKKVLSGVSHVFTELVNATE